MRKEFTLNGVSFVIIVEFGKVRSKNNVGEVVADLRMHTMTLRILGRTYRVASFWDVDLEKTYDIMMKEAESFAAPGQFLPSTMKTLLDLGFKP